MLGRIVYVFRAWCHDLLEDEPAGRIRSMREFFAMAHAMELDAATRYGETSRQLRAQGETALADLFDELAETERGHIRQVDAVGGSRGIAKTRPPRGLFLTHSVPHRTVSQLKLDALSGARIRGAPRATLVRVLDLCGRRMSGRGGMRRNGWLLKKLEHVSLLRRERRKAFHAGRLGIGLPASRSLAALATIEQRLYRSD